LSWGLSRFSFRLDSSSFPCSKFHGNFRTKDYYRLKQSFMRILIVEV
jgi:hypothetical protein